MTTFLRDVRHTFRLMQHEPTSALTIVLTLTVGIGLSLAVFSVLYTVLLQPLSFRDPNSLVTISEIYSDGEDSSVSWPNFLDWKEQLTSFTNLAGYVVNGSDLKTSTGTQHIPVVRVTIQFFDLLGSRPAYGRSFGPGSDSSPAREVLITDSLWRDRYNRNPKVLGQSVALDGESYTIVGVLAKGHDFPSALQDALYAPIIPRGSLYTDRAMGFMSVIGRLNSASHSFQAQKELTLLAERTKPLYADVEDAPTNIRLEDLSKSITGDFSYRLWISMGTVLSVLLIACLNIANLLLAKTVSRDREFAVRIALGAGRVRLVSQILAESLVYGCLGSLGGAVLAITALKGLSTALSQYLPRISEVRLNYPVVLTACLLALFTAVLAGAAPMLYVTKLRISALRDGTSGSGVSRFQKRLRACIAASQIALALTLCSGTGLLIRTMWVLEHRDAGIDMDHVITFKTSVGSVRYNSRNIASQFYQPLLSRLQTYPGVDSAGLVNLLPLEASGFMVTTSSLGLQGGAVFSNGLMEFRVVSQNYYKALGIPTLRGRLFQQSDQLTSEPVAVINMAASKHYFGSRDALGHELRIGKEQREYRIIGIVGDNKQSSITATTQPEVDLDYLQVVPASFLYPLVMPHGITMVIRTKVAALSFVGSLQKIVNSVDPDQPVYEVKTMRDVLHASIQGESLLLGVLELFATIAVLLSALGIYGLMAWIIHGRFREIGIRMALGASRSDIRRMVIGQGLGIALGGLGAGVVLSLLLGRALQSMLFGVAFWNPLFIGIPVIVLLATVIVAVWLPAQRGSSLNPADTLKA